MTITRHGACGGHWWQSGNRTGHCSACHRNFDGISAFDRHRRDGQCLDPATLTHADELVYASRNGTHDADRDVTYWRIASEAWSPADVFHPDRDDA